MPTRRRFIGTAFAGTLAPTLTPIAALAAPRSRLIDQRWSRTGSGGDPDHGAWDAILGAHLKAGSDGINRFDYARANREQLGGYLGRLQGVDPTTLSSGAAFAYWVNLYNALTVYTVQGAFPVSSIRKVGGSVLSPGPWKQKLVRVADQPLSLDDIEHGILRPVWRDPRIHYAVNCAALGCPNLASRAYTSGRLAGMLDAGARAFVNHPRGAQVTGGSLTVSSIYTWFQADFGGTDAGVIQHLQTYATGPQTSALSSVSRIGNDQYDWALNRA